MNKDEQKDSWQTPPELWDPLHAAFDFKFDMAASDENHLLPWYYTAQDSALDVPWPTGWKWCNPPYSKPHPWVRRAAKYRKTVMLLNQDTSTKWAKLARHKANIIILLDWRIRFIHAVTGEVGKSTNKCQQIIIFDEKPPKNGAKVKIFSEGDLHAYCNSRKQSG